MYIFIYGSLHIHIYRWINTLLKPEELLILKEDLLLFNETSNDSIFQFKHDGDKMVTVMNELWTTFEDIQLKSTVRRCRAALEKSLYQVGCMYIHMYIHSMYIHM
jgi:hypothetical protein